MKQPEALLLSLAIEVPFAFLLGHRWTSQGGRLFVVACAATLLTHPFAWASFRELRGVLPSFEARALLIEVCVAAIEGAMYARLVPLGWRRGLLLGLAANAGSFFFGLLWASL